MDVLYIVRDGEANEELRYSLRSLKNFEHDKVFIAGYTPSWVKNVIPIPVKQLGTKYENARKNFYNALHNPLLADTFARMNDDFYIMKPVTELKPLHRGTPTEIYSRYERQLSKGAYFFGLKDTLELLEDQLGIDDIKVYETHTPMVFNKHKARKLLELQARIKPLNVVHVRTLYGNYYHVGGTKIADPKVDQLDTHIPKRSPFLSTNDTSFRDLPVGEYIRDTFTDKCHYER